MEMWAFDNSTDGLRLIFVTTIVVFLIVAGFLQLSDYIQSKRKPK